MKTQSSLTAALVIILAMVVAASRTSAADGPVPTLPWLHEGLVLTFTWYAAVAAGNGSNYEEDGHDGWIDPRTGKRFTRSDQRGTSRSGWNQITIACIDGEKVVLSSSSFANAGALGITSPFRSKVAAAL